MRTNRPRRLEGVSYVGFQRYFLTICTAFRARIFEDEGVVGDVHRQVQQSASRFDMEITAYCYMPDHFHALLTATSEQADFCELVRRFKQVSAFNYRKSKGRALWQPGYHERILRDDEVTEAVVRYILKNPIRAGLTQGLGEYRFAGSEVYDLAGLMTAWANGNHGVKSGSRPKGLHYKYKKLTTKTRKREKDVRRGGPEGPHYEKGRT